MATSSEANLNNTGCVQTTALTAHTLWNPTFYNQLRQNAIHLLRNKQPDGYLQPEDLIHDTYLRLTASPALQSVNDGHHYLAIATITMKRSLIDRARATRAIKRFGQLKRAELTPDVASSTAQPAESLWVNDLLEKCTGSDARSTTAARLHFIEEKTLEEIASLLRVSTRTVKRDLRAATLQLRNEFDLPAKPGRFIH